MKKVLSIIVCLTLGCSVAFSANVPKVNNHGFPQNLKTTQKVYEVETTKAISQENDIEKVNVVSPSVKVSKKKTIVKKQDENKPATIGSTEETISKQEIKPLKKERKQEPRKIKRQNEDGGVASLLSYIFACVALILGCFNVGLAFLFAVPGLILGIVGVSKGKSNRFRGILGIIINSLILLVFLLLLILSVAVLAAAV